MGSTSPIQVACGDNSDAARVLIFHGANVQVQIGYGYSALRYACRNSLSNLPLLVKAGRGNYSWFVRGAPGT